MAVGVFVAGICSEHVGTPLKHLCKCFIAVILWCGVKLGFTPLADGCDDSGVVAVVIVAVIVLWE